MPPFASARLRAKKATTRSFVSVRRSARTTEMDMTTVAGLRFRASRSQERIKILRDVMTLHELELKSAIPDLRDLSLDQLAQLGDSVLGQSIALYLQRLEDNGMILNAFNSNI
jgi:hypothetical protein